MSSIKYYLIKAVRKVFPLAFLDPVGERGIKKVGHREYIGGLWDEVGSLQFNFLCAQGLRPEHRLLDIACGSLRLGVRAIPYLETGHYLGLDKESGLVAAGLENELPKDVRAQKSRQPFEMPAMATISEAISSSSSKRSSRSKIIDSAAEYSSAFWSNSKSSG